MIFERKNVGHMSCCSSLLWDPKSKILLCSVAFSLSAGPRKASENFASNPKISIKYFLYITLLKASPETKFVPYFFKAKNEEKLTKKIDNIL